MTDIPASAPAPRPAPRPAQKRAAPPSPAREVWLSMRANKGAMAGLAVIVLLVLTAVFADWIAPHSPIEQFRQNFLQPPAWAEGGSWEFVLGTDDVGRDLLSRIIYGSRLSLFIGSIVVTISLALGIALGVVSGFFRGVTDIAIMRFMDIILSMPALLLSIVIVAILGPGLVNAMIAVAITYVPHYARLARASVITEMARDYVTAAKVAGAGNMRLMLKIGRGSCGVRVG
jgi:dipeptide transport system permease protein